MQKFLNAVGIGVAFCVTILFYRIGDVIFFEPRGFFSTNSEAASRTILLAVFTFIGIFCQVLHAALKSHKSNRVEIIKVLATVCHSKGFWMAIAASPISIIAVFKSVEQVPDTFLAYAFAFQNGYFFNSLLEKPKK